AGERRLDRAGPRRVPAARRRRLRRPARRPRRAGGQPRPDHRADHRAAAARRGDRRALPPGRRAAGRRPASGPLRAGRRARNAGPGRRDADALSRHGEQSRVRRHLRAHLVRPCGGGLVLLCGHALAQVSPEAMRYVSTRGEAPAVSFLDAVIAGLAPDGGLYVPERWPQLSAAEIAGLAGRSYAEVAADIVGRFAGGAVDPSALAEICAQAYASFDHPAVAPLKQL